MSKFKITPARYIIELFDSYVDKKYPTGWFGPDFKMARVVAVRRKAKKTLRRVAQIINYWNTRVKESGLPADIKDKLMTCNRRFKVLELKSCNSRFCPWCHSRFHAEALKLWADLNPVASVFDVGTAGQRPELARRQVRRTNLMYKIRVVIKYANHAIEAEQHRFNIFEYHAMSSFKNIDPERRKQIEFNGDTFLGEYDAIIKFIPEYVLGTDFNDYRSVVTGLKQLQRPTIECHNNRVKELDNLLKPFL